MTLSANTSVGTRVRYTSGSFGELMRNDEGTVVGNTTPGDRYTTLGIVMDDSHGRPLRSVPGIDAPVHWITSPAGTDFEVIPTGPEGERVFTQAEVDVKVREAVEARNKELAQAIWQAKIDNGLCSEVENFLENHGMDKYIPMTVKVEVYLTVPRSGQADYITVSEAQSLVTNALDSAGVEYTDSDAEEHTDY